MPTLKQLLSSKNAFIAQEQAALESLMIELGNQFANDFARIVGTGVFDLGIILDALDALGYSEAIIAKVQLQGQTIQQVLRFSQQVSGAMGINFALTATNEAQLAAYLAATTDKLLGSFRREIAADLLKMAIEANLSQRPTAQILAEVGEWFEIRGRQAGTELDTALRIFDRAVMKDVYDNAGVELFLYFPDNIIETSRESCIAAVGSRFQRTGWTRKDIQDFPDIDFVLGGKPYYNCRHEFMPFDVVRGVDEFFEENPPLDPE